MSIGIYKIENLINHKIYIGQSIHIEKRWREHCWKTSDSLIGRAIKKYGKENFDFQILEETEDFSQLNDLETKYIKVFDTLAPKGYNLKLDDKQEHHVFAKYSYEDLKKIVDDLKVSNLSFSEIAKKYSLSESTIYSLNRGDYHRLPEEKYPLREVQKQDGKYCLDCGKRIHSASTYCVQCFHFHRRKAVRPDREELKKAIRNFPFIKIGEMFGISDKAIVKWCQAENLPSKAFEIKKYSDEEWELL